MARRRPADGRRRDPGGGERAGRSGDGGRGAAGLTAASAAGSRKGLSEGRTGRTVSTADHDRVLGRPRLHDGDHARSEEHTSELQSLMRISYAVFCLKKKTTNANLNILTISHKHLTHT